MHELAVHTLLWLLISFNNQNYNCHMNFIIFVHLLDTLDLKFKYIIIEHVTTANIILLFDGYYCIFSMSFKSDKISCFTHK